MEVPTSTWTVVQFMDDKTVEAVPTNWLDGNKCYWPLLQQSKLKHAIKKLEPPQPTWIKLAVKSFRNGTFDDYVKARSKAKEAEDTSDLQSEVDESSAPRKRKIYRPSWATSSEESSSDDTMLSTPPNLERKPNIVTAISEESLSPLKRHRVCERKQQAEEETRSFSTIENQGTCQLDNNSTSVEDYCKTILEQQHELHSLLTEVLSRVNRLEENFYEHFALKRGSSSIFKQNIAFPINCEQELQKFETYLQDENNFRDAVHELAKVGGTNNYNFVKRVMACLITKGLGTQYSWLGRKGKKIFHTLELAKIIIDAAEKSGVSKNRRETEISIQLWLRRAMERSRIIVKDL